MQENLPLVSVLIPAYNQTIYLEKALISVLNQSYKNIEIIICDDSTNNEVEKLVSKYTEEYQNIKYYNNKGPLGERGALNMQKCFALSNGEYINYLMHDDLFHKNKIEIMVKYLINNKDVTLVTSHKNFINKNDDPIYIVDSFVEKDCKIHGKKLGFYMLNNMVNIIGEPTTAMFRKNDINDKVLSYKGRKIHGFGDMAIWLKLLSKGNVIYIKEPLSYFRIHDKQNTVDPIIQFWGIVDWYYLITNSYLDNVFIESKEQYLDIIKKWFEKYITKVVFVNGFLNEENEELKELGENLRYCYIHAIKSLIELKE